VTPSPIPTSSPDTIAGFSPNDVTALATLVLATVGAVALITNVVLAWLTWRMARATSDEAEATKEQSKIAARSLRQLQENQELDWRPFLVSMDVGGRVTDRVIRDMVISNIGRGPAINAYYLRFEKSGDDFVFLRTDAMNIGQGQQITKIPAEQRDEQYPSLFRSQTDFPKEWIVCLDQFGNFLCFSPHSVGVGVYREERDERGAVIQEEPEPPWVTVMKQLLWEQQPEPEPEPEPGYAFMRAISITGNPTYCETTIALEAVPANALPPTDAMADVVGPWLRRLDPEAKRDSLDLMWWLHQKPGTMVTDFDGRLEAGPMISVRIPLGLQATKSATTGQSEANLPLLIVVMHWKRIISEGLPIMTQLGARRVRLGLTLFTHGNADQPHLVDVDFEGFQKPDREVAPKGYIQNLLHQSRPFDVGTFPEQDIDDAVRQLLRLFGYREVNRVIAGVKLLQPSTS
jgi:hypothetical protein